MNFNFINVLNKKRFSTYFYQIFICFPVFVFLFQIYVQLVLLLSNPLSFNSRELILYFVWLPIFYLPYFLSKIKLFYYSATSLLGLISFFNLIHIIITYRPLTASSFFIFSNTNPRLRNRKKA